MEKPNNYYLPVYIGIACIAVGAVAVAINGILGFAVIVIGAVMICSPLFKGRAPKAVLDGDVLRITGAFASWEVDAKNIDKVYTVDSIRIVVMTLGYGGHRYIGGEFVDESLGGIYIAADKRIPLFVVVDAGDKRYVFNQTDVQTTDLLFDKISAAVDRD